MFLTILVMEGVEGTSFPRFSDWGGDWECFFYISYCSGGEGSHMSSPRYGVFWRRGQCFWFNFDCGGAE